MPITSSVLLGRNVKVFQPDLVNLYGCTIGDDTKVGAFVEIQKNATIGARCKISSHTFICEGVTIEDEVFVGHGVMFINDIFPRATTDGALQTEADWEGAMIGAGAVVTHDVPANTIAKGVPARMGRDTRSVKVG